MSWTVLYLNDCWNTKEEDIIKNGLPLKMRMLNWRIICSFVHECELIHYARGYHERMALWRMKNGMKYGVIATKHNRMWYISLYLQDPKERKKESTVRKHVDILAKKKQSGFHSSKIQQLGHHTSPKAQSKPRHTLHIYVCLVVECSNHFNCWRCYQCVENAQSNLISQLPLTVWKTSNAPHFSMHNRLWLDTQINE